MPGAVYENHIHSYATLHVSTCDTVVTRKGPGLSTGTWSDFQDFKRAKWFWENSPKKNKYPCGKCNPVK